MMNTFLIPIFFLITIPNISSEDIFSANTTIAHPESGLFLDYVGPYVPSETVIHNSAIFSMTVHTCHFLPAAAAEKIPLCNITSPRPKRALPILIALGAGAISLTFSASNLIQTSNLRKEITTVRQSLTQLSETVQLHRAQLVKIHANQIQLAEQLDTTQKLLESTTSVLNNQSEAINTLHNSIALLQTHIRHSFLYQALTQILQNDLTLTFLAPPDLHTVVYSIIRQGNLTFNPQFGSLPLAHIITRFLIHQQIDFMPSLYYRTSDPLEIGRLVITSFFAVPHPEQPPFLVYKLITTPFTHEGETLQLTQIPMYLAVNPLNNVTIEWYDRENLGCDFYLMTTCRDTPPFRSLSNNTCLGQIVGGSPLSKCLTTSIPPAPFFLKQLRNNLWITSSPQPLHCVTIPRTEFPALSYQTSNLNEQLILPPVALVNVTPGSTIACPGFSLTGRPVEIDTPSVVILYNNTVLRSNITVLNVHRHIAHNNPWSKKKFIGQEIQNILQLVEQPHYLPKNFYSHPIYMSSAIMILLACILVVAIIAIIWYIRRCHPQHILKNVRVTLPPLPTHTTAT
jgi:hypothetical protein